MAVLPLTAFVVEMIEVARSGEAFSWLTVGVVTLLGEATLATAWTGSADGEGPRNVIPEPWRALSIFVGCLLFLLITEAIWGLETPSQLSELGITAAIAATMTLIWYVRYTILAPIIVAALVAWPVAGLIFLFTFWLGSPSFLGTWALSFAVALPFVIPIWASFVQLAGRRVPLMPHRTPRMRRPAFRPPAWLMVGVTCLFMWSPALFMDSVDEKRSAAVVPSEVRSLPAAARPTFDHGSRPFPELAGAPGREAAARQLMDAWKIGDRVLAARVALQAPLDALFAVPPAATDHFEGCDQSSIPATCRIETTHGSVLLEVELHPDTNWFYVASVQLIPTDG